MSTTGFTKTVKELEDPVKARGSSDDETFRFAGGTQGMSATVYQVLGVAWSSQDFKVAGGSVRTRGSKSLRTVESFIIVGLLGGVREEGSQMIQSVDSRVSTTTEGVCKSSQGLRK